jgi:hypothetical protein
MSGPATLRTGGTQIQAIARARRFEIVVSATAGNYQLIVRDRQAPLKCSTERFGFL